MSKVEIIKGDLINLAKQGEFDVIGQGCNCFCNQGVGLAPQMVKAFGTDTFREERKRDSIGRNLVGDVRKLGQIDYETRYISEDQFGNLSYEGDGSNLEGGQVKGFAVVNMYTQYRYGSSNGPPLDYEALTLCLRKTNHIFKNKHIGLPWIGCGLAGGDKDRVLKIIESELKDCKVTIVEYNK